jgi:lipopolysaccharide/colanic/teichoic acid biosynthesis glycosyltransferase
MKRIFDLTASGLGLVIFSPILIFSALVVYLYDFQSPFYIAPRVGKNGKIFNLVKFRSMTIDAGKAGVNSTSANDSRITPIGKIVRAYKIDELPQLWNVFVGEMSLVGPRPQVSAGVDLYTDKEKELLQVRPGITDLSSIVFSDEGEILKDSQDPDRDYDRIIRPWKSRLGLLYVDNMSVPLDIKIIFLTILAILRKEAALGEIQKILIDLKADELLVRMASRKEKLQEHLPPGKNSDWIVNSSQL